jgi:hypothetical protein
MREAAKESLPAHAQNALDDIDLNRGRDVKNAVSNWWNKNGFEEVKNQNFDWSGNVDSGLKKSLREKMSEDPELAIEAYNSISKIDGMVEKLKKAGISTNQGLAPQDVMDEILSSQKITEIDGNALMAIRNQFAKAANRSQTGREPRAIASEIDALIRSQLPDEARDQFDDQIKRYTTALTYADTMRGNAADKAGAFTADEWRNTASKYGGKGLSLKEPPLSAKARTYAKAADSAADTGATEQAALRRTLAQQKKAVTRKAGEKRRENVLSDRVLKRAIDERGKSGDLAVAATNAAELGRKTLTKDPQILSSLLTTGLAGEAIPSVGKKTKAGNVIKGLGIGRALSSNIVQDTLAGQTKLQQMLANALRDQDFSTANLILSRGAAAQATEDEEEY